MKLSQYFVNGARDGQNTTFVKLSDDAPQWLNHAIVDVASKAGFHDWVYEEAKALAYAIEDGSVQHEDDLHMHVDGQVEIYTQPLMQWVADFCLTDLFAEAQSAADDAGGEETDMVKRAMTVQYYAIEIVCRAVFQAYLDNTEAPPSSDEAADSEEE